MKLQEEVNLFSAVKSLILKKSWLHNHTITVHVVFEYSGHVWGEQLVEVFYLPYLALVLTPVAFSCRENRKANKFTTTVACQVTTYFDGWSLTHILYNNERNVFIRNCSCCSGYPFSCTIHFWTRSTAVITGHTWLAMYTSISYSISMPLILLGMFCWINLSTE